MQTVVVLKLGFLADNLYSTNRQAASIVTGPRASRDKKSLGQWCSSICVYVYRTH